MSKGRLSKGRIAAAVTVAAAAALICALLIINIFYPLRYFTAYLVRAQRPPEGELSVYFLDVGQADCAVAVLPDGQTMLIDGGDGTYTNNLKIVTSLHSLGVDGIDYLVCTSVNGEHCGGLAEIINLYDVGTIFYPYCTNRYITEEFADFVSADQLSAAERIISEYGAGVNCGDFYFTFLSPAVHTSPDSEYGDLNSDPTQEAMNNASAVMWMEYAGRGIFYASDVGGTVLSEIAQTYTLLQELGDPDGYFSFEGHKIDFSACAAYKVAAHGHEDSRCTELADLLSPDISIISVGENNASGCPSAAVVTDLIAHGKIYMTQYAGDILLSADGEGGCSVSVQL